MKNTSAARSLVWARRVLVMGLITAYLGMGMLCLYSHLIGDTGRFALGYFWTWDMFPNYPSFSARRLAVGQTKSGQYVNVFPTANVRYRRGGQGDLTRFDLPRNDAALRNAVSDTLQANSPEDLADPVTYVFLIENYWPVRFNLPEDLYQSVYHGPNPHRQAWRIVDEGMVAGDGEVRWTSAP
jgi:hypothetical protein